MYQMIEIEHFSLMHHSTSQNFILIFKIIHQCIYLKIFIMVPLLPILPTELCRAIPTCHEEENEKGFLAPTKHDHTRMSEHRGIVFIDI